MSFVAGQKVRTSDLNALPYATILSAQVRTSNSSAVSAETALVTTPTLTLLANTWYEVDVDFAYIGSTTSANPSARIRDTNVSGTQRAIWAPPKIVTGATGGPYVTRGVYFFKTGASPSPTAWVGTLAIDSGTITAQAGTRILVYQLPANANVTTV